MLKVPSERSRHLSILDGKTIATFINQSFWFEVHWAFCDISSLFIIHWLLISILQTYWLTLVMWAILPLINWWVRYSNSYLKMTDLSISSTSRNRSFFSSKCCTVPGSILTSTNQDITPSMRTKCSWWNKHTDKQGAYHTSNPAPYSQLYIVQQVYLINKWTAV